MVAISLRCCSLRCCITSSILVMFGLFYICFSVTMQLMPEMDMYVSSTCKDKSRIWNGKGAGVLSSILAGHISSIVPMFHQETAVWSRGSNRGSSESNRARLRHGVPRILHSEQQEMPVILIATHHKTGTYLAKKMFSMICAKLDLCCIFHVTNDDVDALKETINYAGANIVAHWQWAWFPEEITPNYRFIHFYRDPLSKISSGYRYHMDGVEAWSRKFPRYSNTCSQVDEQICDGVHLCEPCCNWVLDKYNTSSNKAATPKYPTRQHITRAKEFICEHLGSVGSDGLSSVMSVAPVENGVYMEAGIDYFESLTMAMIANHTWNDPRSLNIDLDLFMADFEGHTRNILKFLQLPHGSSVIQSMTHDLLFFDINDSPLYRAFMENPLYNHVNTNGDSHGQNASEIVRSSKELLEVYHPILELMTGAAERSRRFWERSKNT